jgi:hypothetical protein
MSIPRVENTAILSKQPALKAARTSQGCWSRRGLMSMLRVDTTAMFSKLPASRVTKIVRMLVKNGAKVNAQDGSLGNALRAACATDQYEIVRMLVEEEAELDARVNTMAMLAKLPLITATMKFKLLLKWNMPHV